MGRIPARRKGSRLAEEMPEETRKAEASFYRCPAGHALPNRTNRGECTPIYCAGAAPGPAKKAKKGPRKPADASESAPKDLGRTEPAIQLGVSPGEVLAALRDDVEEEHLKRLQRAAGREKARLKALGVEEVPKGAAAEQWTASRLADLAPLAVLEQEHQLRFGDDEQRARASARILDATGHGKKEMAGGGPTIIISGASFQVPWRGNAVVVDGQVTSQAPIGALPDAKKPT